MSKNSSGDDERAVAFVSFRRGTYILQEGSSSEELRVFGLYEGDTCDDLRAMIMAATDAGRNAGVALSLSREDLVRWRDSSKACAARYYRV